MDGREDGRFEMSWAGACEAIRQTIALYCQLLDDQRYDDLAQLFTDDATLPWQGRTLRGRVEIARGLPSTQEPLGRTRHLPYGSVIDVDGDEASAWTDAIVTLRQADGTMTIAWTGRYHDRLRYVDGRWRFQDHVAVAVGEPVPEQARPVGVHAVERQHDIAR
jgi:ketosteroid isomerase-like protein